VKHAVILKWKTGKYTQQEIADIYNINEYAVPKIINEKLKNRKVLIN